VPTSRGSRAKVRLGLVSGLMAAALFAPNAAPAAHAAPGDQSFTTMSAGFGQDLWGTVPSFVGGMAFAPNGDLWADACVIGGGTLYPFHVTPTTAVNGSTVRLAAAPVSSDAGCGLTNHPDGHLYSNTDAGVTELDATTGAAIAGPFGHAGNALGIAVDPVSHDLFYVGNDAAGAIAIFRLTPGQTTSTVFADLTTAESTFADQIAFDPTGHYLFISNRAPNFRLTVLDNTGAVVQDVPMAHEPDGIAFHTLAPHFVVTNDTDGTMTRFDFGLDDYTKAPTVTTFASGGFRGDMSVVGSDGCLYLAQNGTRYANGTTSAFLDSIVHICPGFAPPTGVAQITCANRRGGAMPDGAVIGYEMVFTCSDAASTAAWTGSGGFNPLSGAVASSMSYRCNALSGGSVTATQTDGAPPVTLNFICVRSTIGPP